MDKKMNPKVLFPLLGLVVIATIAAILLSPQQESTMNEEYVIEPGSAFEAAYTRLTQAAEENQARIQEAAASGTAPYDIEKTVIMINTFELLQADPESSYDEFMQELATLDLEGVAPEVIESKRQLIPVLAQMKRIDQKLSEDFTTWKIISRAVGAGTRRLFSTDNTYYTLIGLFAGGDFNPFLAGSRIAKNEITSIFDSYDAELEGQERVKGELERAKEAYLMYLEQYQPVYSKYMREWDELCVMKDDIYGDIRHNRWKLAAEEAQHLLEQYPDCREGLLLHAMAMAHLGANELRQTSTPIPVELENSDQRIENLLEGRDNVWLQTADADIERYLAIYGPEQSAPAKVIKAVVEMTRGDLERAESLLETAEREYPRQRDALTAAKDVYNLRTYLKKSADGQELLTMYYSMMYGFDFFSPELQRASICELNGNYEQAANLIYNHFYRRLTKPDTNVREPYCGILADLSYCEENLPVSFGLQRLNPAFIGLEFKPDLSKVVSLDKTPYLNVTLHNYDAASLSQVRLVLCYQFADSHKDYYDVASQTVDLGSVAGLGEARSYGEKIPGDHTFGDITRLRAVVCTERGICWIDSEDKRRSLLIDNLNNPLLTVVSNGDSEMPAYTEFLQSHQLDTLQVLNMLKDQSTVSVSVDEESLLNQAIDGMSEWFGADTRKVRHVTVTMPSQLALMKPIFSVGEINKPEAAKYPVRMSLQSGSVSVKFDIPTSDSIYQSYTLHLYSVFGNYTQTIHVNGLTANIADSQAN